MRENKKLRVVCGMSGGVDSAVAAQPYLKQQGHDVVGVFMKNWQDDGQGCSAAADYEDVKSVCAGASDIPLLHGQFRNRNIRTVCFRTFSMNTAVGAHPTRTCCATPKIKFSAFLELRVKCWVLKSLATGHYARTDGKRLLQAPPTLSKDQTYFLCMLTRPFRFRAAMFPIGDMKKAQVRETAAAKLGLQRRGKKGFHRHLFYRRAPVPRVSLRLPARAAGRDPHARRHGGRPASGRHVLYAGAAAWP